MFLYVLIIKWMIVYQALVLMRVGYGRSFGFMGGITMFMGDILDIRAIFQFYGRFPGFKGGTPDIRANYRLYDINQQSHT